MSNIQVTFDCFFLNQKQTLRHLISTRKWCVTVLNGYIIMYLWMRMDGKCNKKSDCYFLIFYSSPCCHSKQSTNWKLFGTILLDNEDGYICKDDNNRQSNWHKSCNSMIIDLLWLLQKQIIPRQKPFSIQPINHWNIWHTTLSNCVFKLYLLKDEGEDWDDT